MSEVPVGRSASASANAAMPVGLIVLSLALANFSVGTGALIIAGILPQIAAALAVTVPQAGALVGYASMGYALGAPLLGAAFGAIDRRTLLLAGLGTMTLASLVGALSTSYEVLIVSRVVFAAASAVVTPTTIAVAAFVVAPEARGTAISRVFGGFAVSNVIGLPLGVMIASLGDWHYALWYAAGVSLVAFVLVWRFLPRDIRVPPSGFAVLARYVMDWRKMSVVAVAALQMGSVFVLYTYVTAWFKFELGFTGQATTWLLLWFGFFGTIGVFAAGTLMQRFKMRPLMFCLLLGVALVHSAFSWMPANVAATMIALALWGVIGFAFQPTQQMRVVQISGEAANAGVSLHASAVYVGQALGAFVGGAVIAGMGIQALGWFAAGMAGLAMLLMLATFTQVGNQNATK